MAQWLRPNIVSMRMPVQSLTLLSGLRIATSCGVGCSCGSYLALLWLWHRLTAPTPIRPLACKLAYATVVTIKREKKLHIKAHFSPTPFYPSFHFTHLSIFFFFQALSLSVVLYDVLICVECLPHPPPPQCLFQEDRQIFLCSLLYPAKVPGTDHGVSDSVFIVILWLRT